MHNSGIIKATLFLCLGLSVCAVARAEYQYQTPCPWPLAEDYSRDARPIQAYIEKLGTITNSKEVGEFRKQLRARVEEDKKIIAEGKRDKQYDQAEEEIKRYNHFLDALYSYTMRFMFTGQVTVGKEKTHVDFQYADLRTSNSSVRVAAYVEDKKMYFFQGNDRVFLEEKDMEVIARQVRQMFYVYYFWDGVDDPDFLKYRAMAITCFNNTRQAMANNKPENIDGRPMPTPGKLNELAPKALELAKKSDSYKDAIDVIIDADDWTIERNSLGIIQRRKVGAWVIKQMKHCKRAFRCQFAQPYNGSGYGELILYGVGGGQFNIK